MSTSIREFSDEQIEAVRQFNDRLKAGGVDLQFPLSSVSEWLPKIAGRRLFQEYYLAIDESDAVRGAYVLKHQDFWIKDRVTSIADFHLPISEGAVSRSYPQVGVQLLRDALGRQPLLYGLGIGGYDQSLTQLLVAGRWSACGIPFYFRVIHPWAFLRNMAYLRRRTAMRWTLDALACSGLGWLGIRAAQALPSRCNRSQPNVPNAGVPNAGAPNAGVPNAGIPNAGIPNAGITVELVDEFSDRADELWRRCRTHYGMTAVRDAETLRILYPQHDPRFIRLKLSQGASVIGWAVLMNSQLADHKHFGNMRLGSIVDNFAAPGHAAAVVCAATAFLQSQGVDLIVSNQSHAAWCRALRRAGFLRGPSNFIFASSPKLTALLRSEGVQMHDLHLNRGDGDGPINL